MEGLQREVEAQQQVEAHFQVEARQILESQIYQQFREQYKTRLFDQWLSAETDAEASIIRSKVALFSDFQNHFIRFLNTGSF